MFPLMQGHGMVNDMMESVKPKRKKKHGGKVPGFRSGGRCDRKPRQAGGPVGALALSLADDVTMAAGHKAGHWLKGKAKEAKDALTRSDDECDDESDNPGIVARKNAEAAGLYDGE
jgi:hypothetical protein